MSTWAGSSSGLAGYADGSDTNARFHFPNGLARDYGTGDSYIADELNHLIRKITPAGVVSTIAGNPGVAEYVDGDRSLAKFNRPKAGIAGSNHILVADYGNSRLRETLV